MSVLMSFIEILYFLSILPLDSHFSLFFFIIVLNIKQSGVNNTNLFYKQVKYLTKFWTMCKILHQLTKFWARIFNYFPLFAEKASEVLPALSSTYLTHKSTTQRRKIGKSRLPLCFMFREEEDPLCPLDRF